MPESKHHPSSSEEGDDCAGVLDDARKALRRGDGWTIDDAHYARLRRDLESIGISCTDINITLALRTALAEIQKLRRREDPSYAGLDAGQTLYECRWKSPYFKRIMYVKFAMHCELVELFTLHEHTDEDKR